MKPHLIANIPLGSVKERHLVRIMFPALYDPKKPIRISQKAIADLYEHAIRPAVKQVYPRSYGEWPPSHSAELWRTGHQKSTRILPGHVVEDWGAQVITNIWDKSGPGGVLHWARGAFFMHQIRGMKTAHTHDGTDADHRRMALRELMQEFTPGYFQDPDSQQNWFVDVGLEMHRRNSVVTWRKGAHHRIIDFLREREGTKTGEQYTSSTSYQVDLVAHLTEVAGFRLGISEELGPNKISYINCYTTEKALTYTAGHASKAKFLSGKAALAPLTSEGRIKYCDDLYAAFVDAKTDSCANARLEVRVPLRYARRVFLDIPEEMIAHSLIVIPNEHWW